MFLNDINSKNTFIKKRKSFFLFKCCNYKNKVAFTLSEVLITLVILGVISAITVPTLFVNYQKTQTVSALKKSYSTLARTTNLAIADNGQVITWDISGLSAENFAKTYFIPYLNLLKQGEFSVYRYKGLNGSSHSFNGYNFYLADGSKVVVKTPSSSDSRKFVSVYVDINGDKTPNIMGKDIFYFIYWMTHSDARFRGKLIPYGGDFSRNSIINSSSSYACNKQSTGDICAALIMKDSWQIKKDYPW